MNYGQSKLNTAANALSQFLQKNQDKYNEFQAKNDQILHCFQNSLTNGSPI